MQTLPVPHCEQIQASDCLAACAAMVLDYLGQPVPYGRLLSLLNIGPLGAPRRNITRLNRLGVEVIYRQATLSIIAAYLQAGRPVIALTPAQVFSALAYYHDHKREVDEVRYQNSYERWQQDQKTYAFA